MTNSRQKGKRGELLLRDLFRKHGYHDARRGQQYAGGPDSPDVVGGPPGYHFECKFRERHDPWAAMEQAVAETNWDVPVVAMKRANKEWLFVLREEDFMRLVHRPDPG